MSAQQLDCVLVGYNETDFGDYEAMSRSSGIDSPQWQIFSKEHLVVDGRPLPWLDAFSALRNRSTGRSDRYHVAEVLNLASVYLTSNLRRAGLRAEMVTLFSAQQAELADLLAQRPHVVAITTTFYVNILPVLPVVDFIRKHNPDTHIVIGGPLVDNICMAGMNEEVLDMLTAMGGDSYVRESQGEAALIELCRAIIAGRSLDGISNLLLPDGDDWAPTGGCPRATTWTPARSTGRAFRRPRSAPPPRYAPHAAARSSAASVTTRPGPAR